MRKTYTIALSFCASLALLASLPCDAAIVAQYHFDEAGGTTAADSVGSIDGTLSGGASFVAGGIAGNAVDLTQATDLVSMGDNFDLDTGDFSIVFWVKTSDSGSDIIPLSKHNSGSENGYVIPIGPNGDGGAADKATFAASQVISASPTSTTSVNDDQWHQIVSVHVDGGSNSIFVNGSPAEDSTASGSLNANSAPFLLGGYTQAGFPVSSYTGLIDEVQIYNHALTNAQVDFLFRNPSLAIPEPGTLSIACLALLCILSSTRCARRA
jgi:hypothetical protein